MAALGIAAGAVAVAKTGLFFAIAFSLWKGIASPMTLFLLTWAGLSVLVDQLIVTDRRIETHEGLAIGAVSAIVISLRGGLSLPVVGRL